MPAREEILDAAARLFVAKGVAGTSTREIAEAIGIRQASLYYHFAGKDQIVEELLDRSIRPTLDKIEKVELLGVSGASASPAAVLYVLLLLDVRTLARAPHNAGVLTRLPEVQRMPYFDRYRTSRTELAAAYGRLVASAQETGSGSATSPPPTAGPGVLNLGSMLLQMAEVVVRMRVGGRTVTPPVADQIARSGLRLCGFSAGLVDAAAEEAIPLIGAFDEL